jgi:hypothetical protein
MTDVCSSLLLIVHLSRCFLLFQLCNIRSELVAEQDQSRQAHLTAMNNLNEEKHRTINELQMRLQDLTTDRQRMDSNNKQNMLEQRLQLEKEHLVR